MAEDEQHNSSEEAGDISRFCTFKRRWIVRAKSKQSLILKASTQNSSVSKAITGSPRRSLSLLAEPWPRGEGAARERSLKNHSANCA